VSLFSLIGIALGVATLIIVMSVMNGFKVDLLKSILGLSGHVTIQSELGNMSDYDAVTARIRRVPGVVRATPVVDGQVMASQGNTNLGVIVRGIRQQDLAKLTVPTNEDFWRTWISYGKPGSVMPAFAKSQGGPLDDLQIASLAQFLNALHPYVATNAPAK
jgi:hypothetical protein